MCWIGADPGGKGRFGVAILFDDGDFKTFCVSCADEAYEKFEKLLPDARGLGIDSPMWWSSGLSGDRKADQFLRKEYKIPAGTVQAANSLCGAALIQGHMLAARARKDRPKLQITEAHPKALLWALGLKDKDWTRIADNFALNGEAPKSDDKRDAVLAAVAAREGFTSKWKTDLSDDRLPSEQNPAELYFGRVHYWWPNKIARGLYGISVEEHWSGAYRDDRMYVMRITRGASRFAGVDAGAGVEEVLDGPTPAAGGWNASVLLITYRNVPSLPAVRVDKFDTFDEAIEYLKKVEPTCPRVSLGGNPPQPTPSWEEYLDWLHRLGLRSATEGDAPRPDWAIREGRFPT